MIDFYNVSKNYGKDMKALSDVTLHVDRGEFVFIVGSSGAGKSTFLKMIMREEVPSSGSIVVDGVDLNKMKPREIPFYRRKLGIVFQDFRIIQTKNVYDNVAFAMHVIGATQKDISRRVAYALNLVGLSHKAKSMPSELSGGEQQRVALARALVNRADIIIADEPTGNIDPVMSKDIVDLLMQINLIHKTTIIMVTHAVDLISQYDKRIVKIDKGCIVSDTDHPEVKDEADAKKAAEPIQEELPGKNNIGFYEDVNSDSGTESFIDSYGLPESSAEEVTEEASFASAGADSGSNEN